MRKLIFIFLGWMVVLNVFALLAQNRFNLNADNAYSWMSFKEIDPLQEWDVIGLHVRWDSEWYLDIAENGYRLKEDDTLANVVFFPLYPLLMKAGSFLLSGNLMLAGWVISSVSLLGALWYLFKLVKEFYPQIDPYMPILFLLIFPTAFFLNAVYTESLFLFLSVAAFYYALKGKFFLAGLFGCAASLTRVTGVLLFLPLVWEYGKQYGFSLRSFLNKSVFPLLLIPAGLGSFLAFHWLAFGDVFLFFKIQEAFGRTFSFNSSHAQLITNAAVVNFILDICFAIGAIVVTVLVFRRVRFSYGIYMASTIIVALSTGTLMSIGRYILVLFPIYLLASSFKNEYVRSAWIAISLLLLALTTLLFASNYWAG